MSTNYSIEGKSRKELRAIANIVRDTFHLSNHIYFPIVELLDIFTKAFPNFSYEIVDDCQLPSSIHAETDIISGHIVIKQSVYDGACGENGRDRMTIAHEFCHYLTLCTLGFKVQRSFGTKIPTYKDPEWQAKCMAGELMINKDLVRNMTPSEISEKCGVSLDAAKYQYMIFKKEENM